VRKKFAPKAKDSFSSATREENAARTSGARPSALISTALLKTSTCLANSFPALAGNERTDNKEKQVFSQQKLEAWIKLRSKSGRNMATAAGEALTRYKQPARFATGPSCSKEI
jgi:hypothetical protein